MQHLSLMLYSVFVNMSVEIVVFIFFFQAEDGIRDYRVTGVQTCALPISPRRAPENEACSRLQVWAATRKPRAGLIFGRPSRCERALVPRTPRKEPEMSA